MRRILIHERTWYAWLLCLDAACSLDLICNNLFTQLLNLCIFLIDYLLKLSIDINLFLHLCSILILNNGIAKRRSIELRGSLILIFLHGFIKSHVQFSHFALELHVLLSQALYLVNAMDLGLVVVYFSLFWLKE